MKEKLPLQRDFYARDTISVAKDLVGKLIIRNLNNRLLIGEIVEVEAYLPFEDEAAHNYKGRTKRNEVLFGEAGHLYVHSLRQYFCMDIVTEDADSPGSVLIRAIRPIQGEEIMIQLRKSTTLEGLTNGPGKVCQALSITKEMNGIDITSKLSSITIVKNASIKELTIQESNRIGITKATDKILRFYLSSGSQ